MGNLAYVTNTHMVSSRVILGLFYFVLLQWTHFRRIEVRDHLYFICESPQPIQGKGLSWMLTYALTHPVVDSLRLFLLSYSALLSSPREMDSAEILNRKQSDVLVKAAHLLAYQCECGVMMTQPTGLGFVHRYSSISWVMLDQFWSKLECREEACQSLVYNALWRRSSWFYSWI